MPKAPLSTPRNPAPPAPSAPEPNRQPRQQRSAITQGKLLEATIRVLDTEGYEAATVPRIAAAAGLSPAALYRRFADKDDLLRAAFLRMLQDSNAANAEHLRANVARPSLQETAEALIAALLKQYRKHPRLLTALIRMLDTGPESPFAKEAMKLISTNLAQAAEILLLHRDSIRHPDPDRAARFAVLSASSAIETAALGEISLWRVALPINDKAFAAELCRQMVAYLRRKP